MCAKYSNSFYILHFLSSKFIETLLVTFVDIVFLTFVEKLFVTYVNSLHTVAELSTAHLTTYYSFKYMY